MDKEFVNLMNNLFLREQTKSIYDMCKKDAEYNLAHYTSLNAVCNIIENGELWFRNPNCMNDYNEITTGKEVILSAIKDENLRFYCRLKNIFDKLNIIESFMQTKEDFYAYIENELNNYVLNIKRNLYICCLTKHLTCFEKEQGRLSMWRSYGLPSNAAVVFSPKFAQSILDHNFSKNALLYIAPVIYGSDKYYGILNEILNLLETFVASNKINNKNNIIDALKQTLAIHLMLIKNKGFVEENEVRLVMLPPNKDTTHIKKDMKVINNTPQVIYKLYIDDDDKYVSIKCSWLKEILVGPTNYYDTIKEALIFQMQKRDNKLSKKYHQIDRTNSSTSDYERLIRKTDIPLRTSF